MALCENNANDMVAFTEDRETKNLKEIEEQTWYLDNGTSNHMTGKRDKFEKLDRTVKGGGEIRRWLTGKN